MGIKFDQVRDASSGNWRSTIFPALAINVPPSKSKHGPCPICGGNKPFRCDDKEGKGTWICNHCGSGNGFRLVELSKGWDFMRVYQEVAAVLGITSDSEITDEERQKWREKAEQDRINAEQERVKSQDAAAKRAARLWAGQSVDRDCPYLERKQVQNFGCKINGKGNLLVPLFDVHGKIWNIQEIHVDGHKPYLKGGRVNDCFYMIGEIKNDWDIVCVAEGYATAASVYMATGYTTIVTFQSGNIDKVASALRSKYPNILFVYTADDDSHSNPPDAGLNAAKKALAITGGIIILPDFKDVTV